MNDTFRKAPLCTLVRVFLWFASLAVAVYLFSLLLSRGGSAGSIGFVFGVTFFFALPVAFLYLPLVVLLRDAEERGWLILLATGILIGPVCLLLWGLLLLLLGQNSHMNWQGDGEAPGTLACMVFAAIVGFLTAGLYIIGLKLFNRRIL